MILELKEDRPSEANIQAEIYHQCRLRDIPCYLEYKVKTENSKGCRFDVVIHKNNMIKAIIEVKSRKLKHSLKGKDRWISTKQCMRYSQFEVPVYYINRMEDVSALIDIIGQNN
jgi:Holliday junction resolvase-like predicted endonuclease